VRNTLSGPIGIYQAAQKSVERLGWDGLFGMLGFLSLNLGSLYLVADSRTRRGGDLPLTDRGGACANWTFVVRHYTGPDPQVGFVMVLY